MAEIYY